VNRKEGGPRTCRTAVVPVFTLALLVVLATSACTSVSTDTSDEVAFTDDGRRSAGPGDRVVVATTFTILADMARRIGGDRVRVESVTTAVANVHLYEPGVNDLKRVEDADLIVSNGLGMDDWLLRFIDGTDARHVITSSEVDPLPVRSGKYTGRPNPHAWMSPVEGAKYIRAIARALADLDPDGAAAYTARAEDYVADLVDLASRARTAVVSVPEQRRVLTTCEGAFSYLTRDIGLDELYLWSVNSENQGLPRQVTSMIEEVRGRDIPAVFCESTVSGAAMEQVAAETGSRLAGMLYVDSLSTPSGPVPTYLDLLDHNLETITRELAL